MVNIPVKDIDFCECCGNKLSVRPGGGIRRNYVAGWCVCGACIKRHNNNHVVRSPLEAKRSALRACWKYRNDCGCCGRLMVKGSRHVDDGADLYLCDSCWYRRTVNGRLVAAKLKRTNDAKKVLHDNRNAYLKSISPEHLLKIVNGEVEE